MVCKRGGVYGSMGLWGFEVSTILWGMGLWGFGPCALETPPLKHDDLIREDFGRFWKIWEILEDVGSFWQILDFARFGKILEDFGRFWKILEDFEKWRRGRLLVYKRGGVLWVMGLWGFSPKSGSMGYGVMGFWAWRPEGTPPPPCPTLQTTLISL